MGYRRIISRALLISFLLTVIALVTWSLNRNSHILEQDSILVYVPARQGQVEQGVVAEGVIIRDEMVYLSPAGGTLKVVAQETSRVRADTVIAEVVPDKALTRTGDNAGIRLNPEKPGVVSFTLDGLERVLTPSSWVDFDAKKVSELISNPVTVESNMHVETGQALFRVIDNYSVYVLVFLEHDIAQSVSDVLTVGRRCNLRFDPIPERLCSARIVSRVGSDDDSKPGALLLQLTDYPHELYYLRQIKAKIVTGIQRGIAIPRQALVKEKDEYLVYTPANLGVNATPVKVISTDESHAICQGLKEGQQVITNPYVVHELGITVWK